MPLTPGQRASRTFRVGPQETARAVGSGSLEVLGTPVVLAWCEAVTCDVLAMELTPGTTSVGTRVALEHLAASPVGTVVTVDAEVRRVDGRQVVLDIRARDNDSGQLLAQGEVIRMVVETARFLARLER